MTTAANDPAGKRTRGSTTPWIVVLTVVVVLGLVAAFHYYHAGESRGGGATTEETFELNLKCNPSEQNEDGPSGCDEEDCAADPWIDGCQAGVYVF